MASTNLGALSNIISDGIKAIESTCSRQGVEFPSLDATPRVDEWSDQKVTEVAQVVIAAAAQLIATLRPPSQSVIEAAASAHLGGTLGVAIELNVAEILRDAGPQGLHISEIAKRARTDSSKLARILRYLATRHIFREVSADVFAANRISFALDTGKSLADISESPADKYVGTTGVAALANVFSEEATMQATSLVEYMKDPQKAHSSEPTDSPFNMAYKTPLSLFQWFESPGNEARMKRFATAMHGLNYLNPADDITKGFDWASLPEGSVVVDVGGGVGSVTLPLAKAYPHLRYVIEDRPSVESHSTSFWKTHFPSALETKMVQFKAHDFYEQQPVTGASVFVVRYVLHIMSNKYCKKVLSNLRAASTKGTKLVVIDAVVPYATATPPEFLGIPGVEMPKVEAPLLANLGIANSFTYTLDMQMMTANNAQERTIGEFVEISNETGWRLERVNRSLGTTSHLIFTPV